MSVIITCSLWLTVFDLGGRLDLPPTLTNVEMICYIQTVVQAADECMTDRMQQVKNTDIYKEKNGAVSAAVSNLNIAWHTHIMNPLPIY